MEFANEQTAKAAKSVAALAELTKAEGVELSDSKPQEYKPTITEKQQRDEKN